MHGAIALGRQGHPMPDTGVPLRYGEALNLAAGLPLAIEPEAGLAPDTPVPAEPLQMGHQVRPGKAPIGQQHHLAATGTRRPSWPCRANDATGAPYSARPALDSLG